jgi:hypothetical protein
VAWDESLVFPLHHAYLHETVVLVLVIDAAAEKVAAPPALPAAGKRPALAPLAGVAAAKGPAATKAAAVTPPRINIGGGLYDEDAVCSGARIDLSRPLNHVNKDSGNARYSVSKELLANARRLYPKCGDFMHCETLMMSTAVDPKPVEHGDGQETMANGSLSLGCAVTYEDMSRVAGVPGSRA